MEKEKDPLADIQKEGIDPFKDMEKETPSKSPTENKPEEAKEKEEPEEGENTPEKDVPFHSILGG